MTPCNNSALIIGVARNCERSIGKSIAKMVELSALFGRAEMVLITNDNTDKTVAAIGSSGFEKRGGKLIVLDGLAKRIKSRTERLAFARNEGLRYLWGLGDVPDYLGMLDSDGVNSALVTGRAFVDAIDTAPQNWCGVFANQQPYYYDIFALRHAKWCAVDCVAEVARRPFYVPRPFAQWNITGARQIAIPPAAKPIRVESAFGGFGLYRTAAIKDCWYQGKDGGADVCEHVAFNRAIEAKGLGGLYILPALLNTAPKEHIFRRFKRPVYQEMYEAGEFD
jgi:hypothetical protein